MQRCDAEHIQWAAEELAIRLASGFGWHSAAPRDLAGEHEYPSDEDMLNALNEPFPVAAVVSALLQLCEVPLPSIVSRAMRTCIALPLSETTEPFQRPD